MPVTFTDERVINYAKIIGFREKNENESMQQYRNDLADEVENRDKVEAHEIRIGKGWDKWTEADKLDMWSRYIK